MTTRSSFRLVATCHAKRDRRRIEFWSCRKPLRALANEDRGDLDGPRGLNGQNAGVPPWRWPGIARLYRGMSLAQTPPGLPLARRLPAGLACRGQPAGVYLAKQGPRRGAPLPPRAGHAWSTFGPHAIGVQRFPTVSNGLQRHVVRAGHRCNPGETSLGQNPDKDEGAGSSPARPTVPALTCGNVGSRSLRRRLL